MRFGVGNSRTLPECRAQCRGPPRNPGARSSSVFSRLITGFLLQLCACEFENEWKELRQEVLRSGIVYILLVRVPSLYRNHWLIRVA